MFSNFCLAGLTFIADGIHASLQCLLWVHFNVQLAVAVPGVLCLFPYHYILSDTKTVHTGSFIESSDDWYALKSYNESEKKKKKKKKTSQDITSRILTLEYSVFLV